MEQIKQNDVAPSFEMQALALPAPDMLAGIASVPLSIDTRATAADWLGSQSNALVAIERLKATIDEETEKLESRAVVDFDMFSQRKNRGLLELTRAIRQAVDLQSDPRLTPHLTQLRASLIRNQAALQIHLDAVREVSAIIARSIQEVESDGTYSLPILGARS